MLTGHKDTDLRVLLELDDREFLIFCGKKYSLQFRNKYINKLCKNENLWRDRLFKYLMSLPKEYGIKPNARNNYAIIWASAKGHLDVVKYLMSLPKEYEINPNAIDNYAIKSASHNGHLHVVNYLLSLPEEYGVHL